MNDLISKYLNVRSDFISDDESLVLYDLIIKSEDLPEVLITLYNNGGRGILNRLPNCPGCGRINSRNTRSNMNHYRFCSKFRELIHQPKVKHPFQYTGDAEHDKLIHELHRSNAQLQIERGVHPFVYSGNKDHNEKVLSRLSIAGKLGSNKNLELYGCAFPNCNYDGDRGEDYNRMIHARKSKLAREQLRQRTGFGRRSIVIFNDKYFDLDSIPEFIGFCYLYYILNFRNIKYNMRFEDEFKKSYYTDLVVNDRYNIEIHPDGCFDEKLRSKEVFESYGIKTIFIPCSRTYSWNYQLTKQGIPVGSYVDKIKEMDRMHKRFIFNLNNTSLQLA